MRSTVLAIDAIDFSRDPLSQYRNEALERETNKALAGFGSPVNAAERWSDQVGALVGLSDIQARSEDESDQDSATEEGDAKEGEVTATRAKICTGNWGCGVFGGEVYLKFLIQLLAASRAQRPMVYIAYQDAVLAEDLRKLLEEIRKNATTVSDLWLLAERYCLARVDGADWESLKVYVEADGKVKVDEETDANSEATEIVTSQQSAAMGSSDMEEVPEEEEGDKKPHIGSRADMEPVGERQDVFPGISGWKSWSQLKTLSTGSFRRPWKQAPMSQR